MEKSELRRIKIENIEEFLSMFKDYMEIYFKLLITRFDNSKMRKELLKFLKEYQQIIKEENMYMKFIMKNNQKMKDFETLNEIIDELDLLNEKTYHFYQQILTQYEEQLERIKTRPINSRKNFKTLIETTQYKEQVLGLLLTIKDLDQYYQQEEAYQYLKQHTKVLNINLEDGIPYFGCFLTEENEKLRQLNLCVPQIVNLKSMLINIHEFKHGITLYPYLGKKVPKYDYEQDAKEEEKKFVLEYLLKNN